MISPSFTAFPSDSSAGSRTPAPQSPAPIAAPPVGSVTKPCSATGPQRAQRRSPEKARNDHFDNVFATFGTYFNGLLTDDRGPLLTQHIARVILRSLGSRLAPDYVESEYILSLLD